MFCSFHFGGVLGGLPFNKRILLSKCYACQDSGASRRVLQYLPKKEIGGLRRAVRHAYTAARAGSDALPALADNRANLYHVATYHHFENGFDDKLDYPTLEEAEAEAQGYVAGTMEADGFAYGKVSEDNEILTTGTKAEGPAFVAVRFYERGDRLSDDYYNQYPFDKWTGT